MFFTVKQSVNYMLGSVNLSNFSNYFSWEISNGLNLTYVSWIDVTVPIPVTFKLYNRILLKIILSIHTRAMNVYSHIDKKNCEIKKDINFNIKKIKIS